MVDIRFKWFSGPVVLNSANAPPLASNAVEFITSRPPDRKAVVIYGQSPSYVDATCSNLFKLKL